jgi:outer membrane protein assembly factor BamB
MGERFIPPFVTQLLKACRVRFYSERMLLRQRLLAIPIALFFLTLSSVGQSQPKPSPSWPGLWGPARNGTSAALRAMPPRSVKELWRHPAAGGYSEIAVAGGRAVTMELRDGVDFVVARDALSGREQWSARIGPTYKGHGGSDDGPISTPTLDGNDVFAAGPHGQLVALDVATGRERWRQDLVQAFGATVPGWGFAASPLVEDGLVLVPTGGPASRGLLAFERATGRLAWSAPHTKSTGYSSAIAATIAGTRQIVIAAGDQIFGVAPDGKLLWSIAGPGASKEVANSPVVLPDDRVLLTFWEDAMLIKISRRDGALSAAEVWRSPRLRGFNGPTIYRDGLLFGFAGPQLVCLDSATGDVRWREKTGEGTLVGIGPQMFLLGQTSGELRIIEASPTGYTESFRTRVFTSEVRSVTGPSFVEGRLYARNLKEIVAFELGR